jgi:hypothetical protein
VIVAWLQRPDRKLLVEEHGGSAKRGDVGPDGRKLDARVARQRLQAARLHLASSDVQQRLAEECDPAGNHDLLYVERTHQRGDSHAETAAGRLNHVANG